MELEGKIDVHNKARQYELALANLKASKEVLPQNKQCIIDFLTDCEDGKTLRNRQRKKIGRARLTRIIDITKRFSIWFNKPFGALTQADLERVMSNLERGVYQKYKPNHELGGAFRQSTIVYYKKTFKKFNRWLQERKINLSLDCGHLETFEIPIEVEAISREDAEKIVYQTSSMMKKAILMTLFDGGMRAEELLNVRLKHLILRDRTYLIRIEFSKTMPRTVILPIASKYLSEWLVCSDAPKDREAQLFPIAYEALRAFIIRSGEKVLQRHITPHTLRHSSASYYCNTLTQYQLCKRYGWSMSSKMPSRYIDREAVADDSITEKIKADETSKLSKENEILKEQIAFMREEQERMKSNQEAQDQMLRTLASQLPAPIQIPYQGTTAMLSVSGLSVNQQFTPLGSSRPSNT